MQVIIKFNCYVRDNEWNTSIPISIKKDLLCKKLLGFIGGDEIESLDSAEKINSAVIKFIKILMITPEDKLDQVINALFE